MTPAEWAVAIARVLVLLSLIQGARKAWTRRHVEPAGSQLGTAVATIVFVIYLVGGVLGVTWYFVFVYPRFLLLFVPIAAGFAIGEWRLVGISGWRAQQWYEARVRRKLEDPKHP